MGAMGLLVVMAAVQAASSKRVANVASSSAVLARMGSIPPLRLLSKLESKQYLNYAVLSRIYDEQPDSMVVTLRGTNTSVGLVEGGGVTILKIKSNNITVDAHWASPSTSIEGQDRAGDLLVVADLSRGGMYTFNIEARPLRPYAYIDLPLTSLLHLKLAQLGPSLIAIGTSGWSHNGPNSSFANSLVAVNVTDARAPTVISIISGMPDLPEGILIEGHYAYVGGCKSQKFVTVDFIDPQAMKVVSVLSEDYYSQMVGATQRVASLQAVRFFALWGSPGGIASINVSAPAHPREVASVVHPSLSKANRVHLFSNSASRAILAFLPLEQSPCGGVGVVDVSDPEHLKFVAAIPVCEEDQNTASYCLATSGAFLYLFSARTAALYIFAIGTIGV